MRKDIFFSFLIGGIDIVEEKLKKIKDLGYEFNKTKDDEQKNKIENELKEIVASLKQDAISKFKNESDIRKFLDNIINFNNYSLNNQLLIWVQNPKADYVTSFKTIQKMGHKLKKDSKGIKIFIPNFTTLVKIFNDDGSYEIKPVYMLNKEELAKYKNKDDETIIFDHQKLKGFSLGNVFDIKDTDIPLDVINKELNPILEDSRAEEIMTPFIKSIYNDGFKIKYEEISDGVKGYCDFENKTIVVKKGMGNIMQLKVLIHEYAHSIAHRHLKNNNKEYNQHRNQYETEAESISYVVSKYLGIETGDYSLNYLYAWSKEKDFQEIDDSLNTIVSYSKKIINNFNKFYDYELEKGIAI